MGTKNEQIILGEMIEKIMNSSTNEEYITIYNFYKMKYKFINNYSLLIGTNDATYADFHLGILSELNSKNFLNSDNSKLIVNHHFADYNNLLYLTKKPKDEVKYDGSVFIDSNAMNIFESFYNQSTTSEFIKFKIDNNIDLNYLPYILEDYINPHHKRKNPEKTFKKITILEIINNLDKKYYLQNNKFQIDDDLLKQNGFNSLDELIEDKKFYFQHFIDKKKHKYKKIYLNNSSYFTYQSKQKFDIYSYLSDFYFIFGHILDILIEKNKDISIEKKVQNILHNMILNGRLLKQILEFAYDYFEDETKVNKFFNYDMTWDYEKIVQATYNNAWDIFLYSSSQNFITNPINKYRAEKADLGISFFLTNDNKFYSSFAKGYMKKLFIINESIGGRPFSVMNEPTNRSNKVEEIINNYYNSNYDYLINIKNRRGKLLRKNKLYSISILFKEKMEYELSKWISS